MCAVAFAFQRIFRGCAAHRPAARCSEDEGIRANLIHLEEEDGVDGEAEPMDRVRKAVWGML